MKDFKFTKEERDSIEDFALDQVLERNFGGIENVTDYIESLIQSRADADGNVWSATLYKIASALLTDRLSEYQEDWAFAKTTPKKVIRQVLSEIEKANKKDRIRANEIGNAIKLIQSVCAAKDAEIAELKRRVEELEQNAPKLVLPSVEEMRKYLNGYFGFGGDPSISDREYGFEHGYDYTIDEIKRLNGI